MSLQWCCLRWAGQSQAMEGASSRGSKELGTGLQQAKSSGISGSKAFLVRQRLSILWCPQLSRQLPVRRGGHQHTGAAFVEKGDPGHTGNSDSPASVQVIMGIYTSFRAGWGSGESGSTRAGVAEGVTSILSWTHSMYRNTPLLQLEVPPLPAGPGTAARALSPWGCPLRHPGCGPLLPPRGAHPSLELAHPAAPHRGTWELNIPSAHHWCMNYEPQCEKAERDVDQRKIPTGCLEGGLTPQDKSSAGWNLPCQTSSFPLLGVLQRLRSIHLCLTQPLAAAPSAVAPGPTHSLL